MKNLASCLFNSVLLVSLWALPGFAGPVPADSLVNFFRPITARVIMPIESGVLIDKGAGAQISPGDLLAVVTNKKELRHPQTGQKLDTVTDYGALLVVTKVKQDLSYCSFFGEKVAVPEGTEVRRYENVPVYFVDATGSGFPLFKYLREQLPHLLWRDYQVTTNAMPVAQPGLVIRYSPDKVEVRNQDHQILFLQQGSTQVEALPPAASVPAKSALGAAITPGAIAFTGQSQPLPMSSASPGVVSESTAVMRINVPGAVEVEALKISDLDLDGQPEVLIGVGGELLIGHIEEDQLIEQTRVATRDRQQIVDLSVLDIDGDKADEVVVTALKDNRAVARVYKVVGGRLVAVAEADMLLGTYQPVTGGPILIGLNSSSVLDAEPQFFSVKLVEGQLDKTPCNLGRVRQPYGVLPLAEGTQSEWLISLTDLDRIRVTDSQGQVRWESSEAYGGSVNALKVPQPGSRNTEDFEKYYFHSKLQRTEHNTILVAQHDEPGLFRKFSAPSNGRLVELSWNGSILEVVMKTSSMGGTIADFDQFDLDGDGVKEIIATVVYRQEGFFQKPVSGLVVLGARR